MRCETLDAGQLNYEYAVFMPIGLLFILYIDADFIPLQTVINKGKNVQDTYRLARRVCAGLYAAPRAAYSQGGGKCSLY